MPTLTINGQTIDRARVPSHLLAAYDQANTAVTAAQNALANWLKPMTVLQAPPNFTGSIHCNAVGQSGYVYQLSEAGGALLVDQRDLALLTSPKINFTVAPFGPTASRRTPACASDWSTSTPRSGKRCAGMVQRGTWSRWPDD